MTEPNTPGPTTPNTPSPGGYVVAVLVAFAWNAAFLSGGNVIGAIAVFVYSFVFGLPIAVAGVLVVHLLCRGVRRQGLHVLTAGACGFVFTGAWWGLQTEALVAVPLALSVGVAAALGRLALVPAVHRRQQRLASADPVRVP